MKQLTIIAIMLFVAAAAVAMVSAQANPLLDAKLPPPPMKHQQQQQQQQQAASSATSSTPAADHSLLSVNAEASAAASAAAAASTEAGTLAGALTEAQLNTEMEAAALAGLSTEERALLFKPIVVPKLPKDFVQPPEYMTPQLTDGDIMKPTKLQDNMQNAINAIVSKAKLNLRQLRDQHAWVEKVNKLLIELSDKRNGVRTHIAHQMKKLKDLLHTKKRIENKQTQEKIKTRLRKTWSSLKKIRTQESYVKKQRLKMLMHKENVAQAIEHIMTSLADLTLVDRDPKIISKTAKVLYDQENYDPDVTDEKTNDEVNELTKPDRMF